MLLRYKKPFPHNNNNNNNNNWEYCLTLRLSPQVKTPVSLTKSEFSSGVRGELRGSALPDKGSDAPPGEGCGDEVPAIEIKTLLYSRFFILDLWNFFFKKIDPPFRRALSAPALSSCPPPWPPSASTRRPAGPPTAPARPR